MKKVSIIFFAALAMLILSSCSHVVKSNSSSFDWLTEAKGPDEILLYDRFNLRFVTYNIQ
ncbi:MAG: lipoprotein [Candidatus Carbobacillus altaicus]|nr:lipoprotein [Candidatus Carbobacillus altaicus]